MSAIDIIRQWYDRIAPNQYMGVIVTATQGGPPQGGRGQTTLFYTGVLTRSGQPGQLDATRGDILFADRQDTSRRPIQPFNALAADQSEFALLPTGTLREHSLTWNFTQEISLSDVGNNVLTGWGGSIGNTGQPSYWVIVVDNTVESIPG